MKQDGVPSVSSGRHPVDRCCLCLACRRRGAWPEARRQWTTPVSGRLAAVLLLPVQSSVLSAAWLQLALSQALPAHRRWVLQRT
jgi:hypothetical protein